MSFVTAIGKKIAPAINRILKPKMAKNTCFNLFSDLPPSHSIVLNNAVKKTAIALPNSKTFSYFTEVNELLNETISRGGKNVQRFRSDEILRLAPIMNKEPEIVKELLSCKSKI